MVFGPLRFPLAYMGIIESRVDRKPLACEDVKIKLLKFVVYEGLTIPIVKFLFSTQSRQQCVANSYKRINLKYAI